MRISALLLVVLCTPSSGSAQNNSTPPTPATGVTDHIPSPTAEIVGDAPHIFAGWTGWDGVSEGSITPITPISSFSGPLCPKDNSCPQESSYLYIIHIADWNDRPVNNGFETTLQSSSWYFYRWQNGSFQSAANHGKTPSFFDIKTGTLISVSRIATTQDRNTPAPQIKYTITATQKTATNVAALEALLSKILGVDTSTPKTENFVKPPEVHYNLSVQRLSLSTTNPVHAPFDWTLAANVLPPDHPAGDGDCSNLLSKAKCTFSQTVSVLSHQYWDVGVNIVPAGPRENKYSLSSSDTVTQTHTIHSALVGAFDFSPWAYKLSMDNWLYFQVGLPLSGSSFHMPYFGVAQPLPFTKKWLSLSVYGGVILMKQTYPKTLAIGATTTPNAFNADLTTDWPVKALYGIEVPVSKIASKVKSSVGGKSSSSSGKGSS
jgi:hypothetical protein